MTQPDSSNSTASQTSDNNKSAPTPARCLSGASISGVLAVGLYFLTSAIATAFAHTPVSTKNMFAVKIAIAVRTLVIGVSTLATGIFSLVTLGLIALAIQLIIKKYSNPKQT
jgi:hypothetical protein